MKHPNYLFRSVTSLLLILFVLILAGCSIKSVPPADAICSSGGDVRFAVIGDYGSGSRHEWGVSELVKRWKPDFVTTVGDNNYPVGSPDTIDANIGRYYQEFISPYRGKYGPGAKVNRFFPIPGHRDWDTDELATYLDYFELPGNERYYDFVAGPVHFFMIDTDTREPDGAVVDSVQARWLKQRLQASTSPWKLVYASHAPYTSHTVEDIYRMRWPFAAWGADALLSGYYHVYERLSIDGIPYFINGAGGSTVSYFGEIDPNSKVRYRDNFGAMLVTANKSTICFDYYNTWGKRIDSFSVRK
ncbi:MAG: metallophosphoesterase [Acidiferrobacterales bacterium]